jgi:hypothetical protein
MRVGVVKHRRTRMSRDGMTTVEGPDHSIAKTLVHEHLGDQRRTYWVEKVQGLTVFIFLNFNS